MKKTGLLYIILFLSTLVSAQDACAELTVYNKKNVKRAYRMTSTMEKMGTKTVMEQGKGGEIHTTTAMDFMGQKQNTETIIAGSIIYMKRNEGDWTKQAMDSAQIAQIKNQGADNLTQVYKNCKKLDNAVIEGKTFRVYSAEFDPDKMKELMDKSSAQAQQTTEMMSQMNMKMLYYINEKDDISKTTMSMSMMGQSFDTDMVYEYDVPITITIPITAKEGKK